ncbi:hypothetical protein [Methylophilus sp. TWE2]|jgi:hypothetical protein|uniref:hypothetical protein n=1 Tax=Methylophilus sp. TWE2 TaxID=1662285 RepID=UPI0006715979|nr:hypothetical protein [Methylophilus sp. TWE2]AKR44091.1 hypothetical protein ACJ67_12230 [Methylophilus sp. TWE2]
MVTHLFMQAKTLQQIFLWPVVIAILSCTGLIAALLYDDMRELVSDTAVALPILIAAYHYWLKPVRQRKYRPALEKTYRKQNATR